MHTHHTLRGVPPPDGTAAHVAFALGSTILGHAPCTRAEDHRRLAQVATRGSLEPLQTPSPGLFPQRRSQLPRANLRAPWSPQGSCGRAEGVDDGAGHEAEGPSGVCSHEAHLSSAQGLRWGGSQAWIQGPDGHRIPRRLQSLMFTLAFRAIREDHRSRFAAGTYLNSS